MTGSPPSPRLRRDLIQRLRQSRQSSRAITRERRRMAVRQGFEPVEPHFSKLVMACGFGA